MAEQVLFENERRLDRSEIATYLRTVADKLDAGDSITLSAGDESTTLAVPAQPVFEVKAEREGTAPDTELSVEFELEWDEHSSDGDGTRGNLEIE